MANASNYLENAVLNYFLRNQAVPQPTQLFLALYINDPTDDDVGTEIAGGAYNRKQITFGAPLQVGTKAVISNNAKVEYEIATSDWGKVSHWGIRDAATGGNLLVRGNFSRADNIFTGNRFSIEVGNLQITID